MRPIVKAALAVAKYYPVFPTTQDKMPALSNVAASKLLGRIIGKGEGGFKLASQDPAIIAKMFSAPQAVTVSVPMGPMSGLLCIDPDLYKGQHVVDWHDANRDWLETTLCHKSQSGGLHYIFKWTDQVKFPATLAEGVDVKGHGGYIVFPPSGGYEVLHNNVIVDVPIDALRAAMVAKGGTGNVRLGSSFSDDSDDDLIQRIQEATDLYPALRSLSYRLPSRRQENGYRMTQIEMITTLENLMDTSVAADPSHDRHDDWTDRRSKIVELVTTSMEKESGGVALTDADIELMTQGETFIKTQEMLVANQRPIGPQPKLTADQIEQVILEMGTKDTNSDASESSSELKKLNAKQLRKERIDPLQWIIPNMLPIKSTTSLAGQSNVGKTRWLASLVTGLAVGDTARMGLPQCVGKVNSLWIANEEAKDDIARRVKAVMLQHNDKDSADIYVRGKDTGMMKLVVLNEIGMPEIDGKAVAKLVKWIRENEVGFLILDPYNTISDGDENSSSSTGLTTEAMLTVISMTDCCVMFAHHCPKDRQKDHDWLRGEQAAWRGSSQIYSSLDCGYTLAHYMPKNGEQRKAWKKAYLDEDLSKWVVLDVGKIREGEGFPPVHYQLVGQEMDEGEGRPIGVCRLATQAEADNALLHSNADIIAASMLGTDLINTMGYGRFTSMAKVAKDMKGHEAIPDLTQSKGKQDMYAMFNETVACENGYVTMVDGGTAKQSWAIICEEKEKGNG